MSELNSDGPIVVGIDPSLSGTAVTKGHGILDATTKRFTSKASGTDPRLRTERLKILAQDAMEFVTSGGEPSLILIEGYSFGSIGGQAMTRAEYRGILFLDMVSTSARIIEVSPGTLKKFVAGSGAAKKEVMILEAYKRWGVEFKTNDEVDSYGLWRLGMCLEGLIDPENAKQRESVAAVCSSK